MWFALNFVWWTASIVLISGFGIDLNPWLDNRGEIVFNIAIWLIGHIAIYSTSKDIGVDE